MAKKLRNVLFLCTGNSARSMPLAHLDDRMLLAKVQEIGREEGASPGAVQG